MEQVLERAVESWPEEGSIEEKWTVVQSALTETADQQLGKVFGNNPDWFREPMGRLTPLLQERNAAYQKYLHSQRTRRPQEVQGGKRKSKERDKESKEQVV